jgi:hypothetical protein
MRCDQSISEACDLVGSSVLVEEVINSVFGTSQIFIGIYMQLTKGPVFIIRFVERRIDQLLDPAIMEYLPPNSQADGVQFESEWSFLKALSNRKKAPPAPASSVPDTTTSRQRSATVTPSSSSGSNGNPAFQSVRHSMSRIRTPSATPMQATFSDGPASLSPADAIYFLDAMHTFMLITGINPALIVQIWSQVFYWTACTCLSVSAAGSVSNRLKVKHSTGYLLARNICVGMCICCQVGYAHIIPDRERLKSPPISQHSKTG